MIRRDRNNEGGGVLLAVKTKYKNCTFEIETESTKHLEELWVRMGTKTKYSVGIVYSPQGEKAKVKE